MASNSERKFNAIDSVLGDIDEYPPALILARRMHLDGISLEMATRWLYGKLSHHPLQLRFMVHSYFMAISTNENDWADDLRLEYLAINLVMDRQKKGKLKKRAKNSFLDALER